MGIFKRPEVQRQDPAGDAEKAAAAAAQAANADTAFRKKQRRNSSLLAQGAQGVQGPVSTLRAGATGKETLGS